MTIKQLKSRSSEYQRFKGLKHYNALQPRRPWCETSPLWKSQSLNNKTKCFQRPDIVYI